MTYCIAKIFKSCAALLMYKSITLLMHHTQCSNITAQLNDYQILHNNN